MFRFQLSNVIFIVELASNGQVVLITLYGSMKIYYYYVLNFERTCILDAMSHYYNKV